ncbi:MAG: YcxB family protein [Acidobacteria bacterium]|nr:YcxB family protein [Acidobacteriota bacterium]
MSEHIVKVTYTEELIRSAARSYWRRGFGNAGLIALGLVGFWCLVMAWLRVDSWILSFFAGAWVICLVVVVVIYVGIRNRGLNIYRKMDNKTATFTFTETGIAIEADNGKSEIPWKTIDTVIQYPDQWLFSISSSYLTLPTASVTTETKEYILAHCPKTK